MFEKFKEKNYKKDDEFELSIKLDDYVLFPCCKIKGKIEFKRKKDNIEFEKEKKKEFKIKYKLTQFMKYEYEYEGILGSKGDYKNDPNKRIIFETELYQICPKNFKEESFSLDLDDIFLPGEEIKDFYPTFEYREDKIYLFIRHLLTIEIPELKTMNSTGIIICKLPKQNIEKNFKIIYDDFTWNYFLKKKGKISYEFRIQKLIYSLNEEIPVTLAINTEDLKNVEIDSIEIFLQKKIKIKGLVNLKFWKENDGEKIVKLSTKKFSGDEVKKKKLNFSEKLQIESDELPEFAKNEYDKENIPKYSKKEIEKYTKFDSNFLEKENHNVQRKDLNPSIDSEDFLCEYKVKFVIKFNRKTMLDESDELVIDLYTLKPSFIDKCIQSYFKTKESSSFIFGDEIDLDKKNEKNQV